MDTFSIPTPNVDTSFLTKLSVCGVIVASDTATELINFQTNKQTKREISERMLRCNLTLAQQVQTRYAGVPWHLF